MNWLSTEPAKDGRRILRFHRIYKCIVTVFYQPKNAIGEDGENNGCVWTTGTLSQTWPEGAFCPEWAEELQPPASHNNN